MNTLKKICRNCRFFPLPSAWEQEQWARGDIQSLRGNNECRRHAPVLVASATRSPNWSDDTFSRTKYASTTPEDGCGDFELREGYGSNVRPEP